MPSASDIRAGGAFTELYTKNGPLYAGLKAAQRRINGFVSSVMSAGKRLSAIGGAITGPLVASAKYFASAGDRLDKMANRTGIAGSSLNELAFAAEQGGTDLETFEASVQRMQRSLYNASERGLKAPAEALASIGLASKDLMRLDPEEQFMAIAAAIDQIDDPTTKAGVAMQIFGQAGRQLLPMMKDLAKTRQQARDFGLGIDNADIKLSAAFTDQMNILRRVLLAGVFKAGAAIAPMLGEMIMKIVKVAKAAADWIDQNRGLFVILLKIGAAIGAAGVALMALGGAGMVLSGIVGGIATAITTFGTVLGVAGSVLGFLLSPIGLVTAALVGLGAYFAWSSGAAGTAANWIMERFGQLWGFVKEVYGGIADAMAAGDLQLAAEVAWAGIRVAWETGLAWLRQQWADLRFFLVDMWGQAAFGVLDVMSNLWAGMVDGFWTAVYAIADAWKWAEKTIAKGVGWIIAKLKGIDPADVIANLEADYAGQQRGRGQALEQRKADAASANAARLAAIEAAKQEWTAGASAKRDAAIAGASADLEEAKKNFAKAREAAAMARLLAANASRDDNPEEKDTFAPAKAAMDQGGLSQSASMFSAEAHKIMAEARGREQAQRTREQQLAILKRIEKKTGASTILKEAVPPGR